MPILVSGSIAYDYIMDFPGRFGDHIFPKNIHILNVFFPIERLVKSLGGTAGNIAYTMKLLGSEPLVVGALGKDGGEYLDHMRRKRISAKYIFSDKTALTASGHIITDKDDNQVGAFFQGVQAKRAPNVSEVREKISLAIVAPSHIFTMKRHLRECSAKDMSIMFDPGQWSPSFNGAGFREGIRKSRFVIGNDYEIRIMTERTGWTPRDITKHGPVLITTLGKKGSVIMTPDGKTIRIASCPPKKLMDPTGAGDAYRAGFLHGFEYGYDLKICGQIGSVAAAYCIEQQGTQEHDFTKNEFSARYQKTYGERVKI